MPIHIKENAGIRASIHSLALREVLLVPSSKNIQNSLLCKVFCFVVYLDVVAKPVVVMFSCRHNCSREKIGRTAPVVTWEHQDDLIVSDACLFQILVNHESIHSMSVVKVKLGGAHNHV